MRGLEALLEVNDLLGVKRLLLDSSLLTNCFVILSDRLSSVRDLCRVLFVMLSGGTQNFKPHAFVVGSDAVGIFNIKFYFLRLILKMVRDCV